MPEYLAPGVYVEETSFRARSIQGVGTSTTGFVGPTRKGPPSSGPDGFVPEVLTSFADFERIYGGLDDLAMGDEARAVNYLAHAVRGFFNEGGMRLYVARTFQARAGSSGRATATIVEGADDQPHARFRARFAGAALHGHVIASELLQPATPRLMETAPVGTLVRNQGLPPQPARLDASAPPGALDDGAELELRVGGGAARTLTFRGQPARVRAAADLADPIAVPAGALLRVTIDGVTQTLGFVEGNVDRQAFVTGLNDDLGGASARLEGDRLVIESDRRGRTANILVEVAPDDFLGGPFEALPAGPANVDDMDRITPADLDRVLAEAGLADDVRAALVERTPFLRLVSSATGPAASLELLDTPAREALGFGADPAAGAPGVERQYLVREADVDEAPSWRAYTRIGDRFQPGAASVAPAVGAASHALVELKLEIVDADDNSLTYEGLGLGDGHPRHIGRVLDPAATRRAEILDHPIAFHGAQVNPADLHAALFAAGQAEPETGALRRRHALADGDDGAQPALQAYEQALARLAQIEDIAIVAAPGHSAVPATADAVQRALIGHAERSGFRIAVLDPPERQTPGEARVVRGQIDSSYAALYWPWIVIANPRARPGREDIPRELSVPPSGHIAGIFARNDSLRGVWKSPANEVVREALRFEREVSHGEQEVLNPIGINCLRYFVGRGHRVWGARLATSDREVVYVSDRRYLNYLKRSVDVSTQWAVFEPNGPRLWSSITDAVSSFLYAEWRAGALLGATPEQAYFVRCDRSTMSQADLDNGRLICEIGVAIVKPAEFVIFRIGQKTADARG